ncbi:hypothetical protein HER39_19835, partial [Arthrobacter deserti]|nr:hypothetical protein [Arthrobacter deserti]
RSGAAFGYDIPLASGEYSVRLHFAEIWHGTQSWAPGGEGKRAFGVNLEGGTPEIESLDLGAAAGTATAHTVALPVTVSDGNLDIDLFSIIDEATIAGIEVLPAGTETPPEEQAETVRVNAGAGAVTAGGLDWQADGFFTGGKTFTNSALTQIAGTEADEVYRSERSGSSFGYRLPLAPGEYTVRLHFAEIWHGTQSWAPGGAGRRVFDVNLEGGAVELDGLDLGAAAGTASAYVATEVVAVTDGSLDIDFTAIVDQATVSAIE